MPVEGVKVVVASAQAIAELAPTLAAMPLLARYDWVAEKLSASLQRAQMMGDSVEVATTADGSCLGLAWYAPTGGLGRAGYLKLLAVVPEAAGRGVGRELLQAFERACAASLGGTMLLCDSTNTKALAFYSRFGYRQVGALPGFVRADKTECLLHKTQQVTGQQNGR